MAPGSGLVAVVVARLAETFSCYHLVAGGGLASGPTPASGLAVCVCHYCLAICANATAATGLIIIIIRRGSDVVLDVPDMYK